MAASKSLSLPGPRQVVNWLGYALLLCLPFLIDSPYYIKLAMLVAIFGILVMGLDIVVGYIGEVSLGHAALFGIGAYGAGVMAFQLGLGITAGLPVAIVVTALFGLVLALPALRVTGPYLAMVTLAFGTIIQILINEMTFLTNGPLGVNLKRPFILGVFDGPTEYYLLVILLLGVVIIATNRVIGSRFGRAFEALRDSPIACDCMGVSVYRHKVYAVVFSAALAGLAGSLFAYSERYISPNTYSFEQTILFLLAATMGGRKSRLGPLIGSAIVIMLPQILSDIELVRIMAAGIAVIGAGVIVRAFLRRDPARIRLLVPSVLCIAFLPLTLILESVTDLRLTLFGLMILFVVYYLPDGILGWLTQRVGPKLGVRPQLPALGELADIPAWSPSRPAAAGTEVLLDVTGMVMQFGGLRALDNVDIKVRPSTVHGLIGPNGSGKSTTMNLLTGVYKPTAGSIKLAGHELAGAEPAMIARRGIARTFQNVQLFGEMSVLDNVRVGLHNSQTTNFLDVVLALPRQKRAEETARQQALGILRFMGLDMLANEQARNLPYGKQRLLEIGRALALEPTLLLLDEPAAGLTAPDIRELMVIIRRIRDAGITIILIEHHMDVVMSICDTVTVLDFGQKIAEGRPAEVQADPRVIEAYLGGVATEAV